MDLISKLADAIIELNNAHPRSPTKEEIAELLAHYLFVTGADTATYKLPGISRAQARKDWSERDRREHDEALKLADPKSSLSRLRLDGHPEADKAAAETYTYTPNEFDKAFDRIFNNHIMTEGSPGAGAVANAAKFG